MPMVIKMRYFLANLASLPKANFHFTFNNLPSLDNSLPKLSLQNLKILILPSLQRKNNFIGLRTIFTELPWIRT